MATASKDRRTSLRHPAQPEQMVVFDMKGYPVYQLKLQDVSKTGAGVIVRHDSKLLTLVQVDQQLTMRVLSPKNSRVSERFTKSVSPTFLNQRRADSKGIWSWG